MSTRVSVIIEVPDGWELTNLEPVHVNRGEFYLIIERTVAEWIPTGPSTTKYFRVRPAWQWPSWLKNAAAVAMDADLEWRAFRDVPCASGYGWFSASGFVNLSHLCGDLLPDFTPPPCTDWRDSLRINPRKATT